MSAPTIDGALEDDCWNRAYHATLRRPSADDSTRASATAKLLWDDTYLHFSANIIDPTPKSLESHRDSPVWTDDCFEIFLDPGGDGRNYYELDFNSQGVIWDSLRFMDSAGKGRLLRGWNAASLEVSTKPAPGGWTLEAKVRLDEFPGAGHLPPHHGDSWRANFYYLDSVVGNNRQTALAWNPTTSIEDKGQFGEIQFLDWEEDIQDRIARGLAARLLNSKTLSKTIPLTTPNAPIEATSLAKPYLKDGQNWRHETGFGRVITLPQKSEAPQRWIVRPNGSGAPTQIALSAPIDGTIVLLARLSDPFPALVQNGDADGVWFSATANSAEAKTRIFDGNWRALTLDVQAGTSVKISVDAGPAGNWAGDSIEVAGWVAPKGDIRTSLPANWTSFGDPHTVFADPKSGGIEVLAGPRFNGARMEIPAVSGARIYKVSGQVRANLQGITRGHVGIDFLDGNGRFLRQATTRESLNDFLRWGLFNFGGQKSWTPFVAYAYDVPTGAERLSLWVGTNAWESPDARGEASFSQLKVEAVPFDKSLSLGFPMLKWEPLKPSTSTVAPDPFILSRTSTSAYVLPDMKPDSGPPMQALSWPGAKTSASFSLSAARNLKVVRVSASDLRQESTASAVIPASRITIRRVRYLPRKWDMMRSDEYLLSPNHLETFNAISVAKNQTQQCWLTIEIPSGTAAGHYTGSVRVMTDAGNKLMPLNVDVLPIAPSMPPGKLLGFYCYYLPKDTPEVLSERLRDMRDHGLTMTFLFNDNLRIPIEPDASGLPTIQWQGRNQLSEFFEAYKTAGFKETALLLGPKVFYEAAKRSSQNQTEFTAVYAKLWEQVRARGREKGWAPFAVAPYDEGYPYPFTPLRFERTRECTPPLRQAGIPVALHSLNHPSTGGWKFEREFEPTTDIILQTFCHPPATDGTGYRGYASWEAYRDAMRGQGKRVLFYNEDVTGVHPEAMRFAFGVGLWKSGADGMTNWHYYEDMKDGGYGLSPAQGHAVKNFVFPPGFGYPGGPTLAWEAVREGIQDYQLLSTLDRLISQAAGSKNATLRQRAGQARAEIDSYLSRVRLSTIRTTGALSLGDWQREYIDSKGERRIAGEFKIPNGMGIDDYDRLRSLAGRWIMALSVKAR